MEAQETSEPKLPPGDWLELDNPQALSEDGVSVGRDKRTGERVRAASVDASMVDSLSALAKITHAHLVPIEHVVEYQGAWLALSKEIAGTQLSSRLATIGRKHTVDAVRTALRLADALTALHDSGGVHGRVHPGNVLLEPEGRVEPALVFGSIPSAAFLRPEASSGEPPSVLDDTWACAALLLTMMTGQPPPREGVESADSLKELGVADAVLAEAIASCLNRNLGQRSESLHAFKRELARWFVVHAGEEPALLVASTHKPPPLPPSIHPHHQTARVRASRRPLADRIAPNLRRPALFAGAAVVLGLGGAWAVSAMKSPPSVPSAQPALSASAPTESPSAAAIDLADVPVTGKELRAGDSTASCVTGYLREGLVPKGITLDWLCSETDAIRAASRLRPVFAAGAQSTSAPTSQFKSLGWYALAAVAALRTACCSEAPATTVGGVDASCPTFAASLAELGRAAASSQSLDVPIKKFSHEAACAAHGKPPAPLPSEPPTAAQEIAFRDLFRPPQAP